jgi:rod shape-determining protein MreD
MKSNVVTINITRFILLLLAQGLIFRRMTFELGNLGYVHMLIYPLFILLLPLKTPRSLVVGLGFILGLGVDLFYNSPGVHASALVFTAYFRGLILRILAPYEGYNVEDSPTLVTMGFAWYMSYIAAAMILHIFIYFSVEAFSFVYITEIALNTLFSYIATFIIIMIVDLIFRMKH